MSYRPLLYSNPNISSERYFEFEGGATLPLFWVTLLNEEVINQLRPKLEYVEKLSEEENEFFYASAESSSYFKLEIVMKNFKKNTEKGIAYISKLYPDYLPLYKEFVKFIYPPTDKGNFILIDIFDFFQDTDNANETIQFLLEAIKPFQQNRLYDEDYQNPALIVGSYEKNFASYSKVYSDCLLELRKAEVEKAKIEKKLNERQQTLKDKISYKLIPEIISWISIIIAVLSALISWFFYKKDGFFAITTFTFILLTIFMFYISLKVTK